MSPLQAGSPSGSAAGQGADLPAVQRQAGRLHCSSKAQYHRRVVFTAHKRAGLRAHTRRIHDRYQDKSRYVLVAMLLRELLIKKMQINYGLLP